MHICVYGHRCICFIALLYKCSYVEINVHTLTAETHSNQ